MMGGTPGGGPKAASVGCVQGFGRREGLIVSGIAVVLTEENLVTLTDGRSLEYDFIVIATGTSARPDQIEGMTGSQWRRSVFDFFTLEGAAGRPDRRDADQVPGGAAGEVDPRRRRARGTEVP